MSLNDVFCLRNKNENRTDSIDSEWKQLKLIFVFRRNQIDEVRGLKKVKFVIFHWDFSQVQFFSPTLMKTLEKNEIDVQRSIWFSMKAIKSDKVHVWWKSSTSRCFLFICFVLCSTLCNASFSLRTLVQRFSFLWKVNWKSNEIIFHLELFSSATVFRSFSMISSLHFSAENQRRRKRKENWTDFWKCFSRFQSKFEKKVSRFSRQHKIEIRLDDTISCETLNLKLCDEHRFLFFCFESTFLSFWKWEQKCNSPTFLNVLSLCVDRFLD